MPGPEQIHMTADFSLWAQIEPEAEVLQFAVIRDGVKIGKGTRICSHVYVDKDVRIGKWCKIKNHVFLCEGVRIQDQVFIGPGATFLNDPSPHAYQKSGPPYPITRVECRATIGARAVIFPGLTIGTGATVGANATVLADVPPGETVVGVWKGKREEKDGIQGRLKLRADVTEVHEKAQPKPDRSDVEAMTVRTLRRRLKNAEISIPSRAKKAKLVELYFQYLQDAHGR